MYIEYRVEISNLRLTKSLLSNLGEYLIHAQSRRLVHSPWKVVLHKSYPRGVFHFVIRESVQARLLVALILLDYELHLFL